MQVSEYNPALYDSIKRVGDLVITSKLLGQGTFSKVYLGYYKTVDEPVAIKVISKEKLSQRDIELLEREITNLDTVKHRNICKIKNLSQGKQFFYISMELCKKGTLRDYMKDKKLTTDLIFVIFAQIFEGLRHLFNCKIIHRDLKLENILVDEFDVLKISDFGFSKQLEDMNLRSDMTKVGTPLYASFEILTGQVYSSKCDVYSTGVLLFEMIYGHHPFFPDSNPGNLRELVNALNENREINFPKQPFITDGLKDLLRGMLKVREEEDNRFSWPEVFNRFEMELDHALKKEETLKKFIKERSDLKFFDTVFQLFTETTDLLQFETKIYLLMRIRFCVLIIHSHRTNALIKTIAALKEADTNERTVNLSKVLTRDFQSIVDKYLINLTNPYVVEMNELLQYDKEDPSKNNLNDSIKLMKEKIKEVFESLKNELAFDTLKPCSKKLLTSLRILKDYPAFPKAFSDSLLIEIWEKEAEASIRKYIFE